MDFYVQRTKGRLGTWKNVQPSEWELFWVVTELILNLRGISNSSQSLSDNPAKISTPQTVFRLSHLKVGFVKVNLQCYVWLVSHSD